MNKAEKRRCKRKTYGAPVDYSVSISKHRASKTITITETAMAVDISKKGMGIITSYPVMPDHLLRIKGLNGSSLSADAVVRWRAKKGLWYRVGLMFV